MFGHTAEQNLRQSRSTYTADTYQLGAQTLRRGSDDVGRSPVSQQPHD